MNTRLALLTLGTVLLLAPAAQAKSPPKGDYGCTYASFSGTFYAGTLNILGKSKYSVNDKKKGKYTTKGKRINFKTGDYKTIYYGKWNRGKSVIDGSTYYEIELYGKKDNKQKLSCTRSRA